jgi:hypothetical protein
MYQQGVRLPSSKLVSHSVQVYLFVFAAGAIAIGQNYLVDPVSNNGYKPNGFEFVSASGYWSRTTSIVPPAQVIPSLTDLNTQNSAGISATIGIGKQAADSSFNLLYTPNVFYTSNYGWKGVNHSLGLAYWRKLAPRLTLNIDGNGYYGDINQFDFVPTQLANLVGAAGSPADLSNALLTGTYNDSQLGSILGGTPALQSQGQRYFYGNRIFIGGLNTSLTYLLSPRLTLTMSVRANQIKAISNNLPTPVAPSLLLHTSTTGYSQIALNYNVTDHLTLGGYVDGGKYFSAVSDAYNADAGVNAGYNWKHVFASIRAGTGKNFIVNVSAPYLTPVQATGAAAVGFRTTSNTLYLDYQRSLGNSFGLPGQYTDSVDGAWNLARPGRRWSVTISGGTQELHGGGYTYRSYRGIAGLGYSLNQETALQFQFFRGNNTAGFLNGIGNSPVFNLLAGASGIVQEGVRVSVVWSPRNGFFEEGGLAPKQ